MSRDPRTILAEAPMRPLQIWIIVVTTLLNALDGFDVLSISFAAPGIAKDWHVDRAALGIVLSMELIGMTIGSVVLGWLCDRCGRRPTILMCLVIMAGGMLLASTATGVGTLSAFRFGTGLGIGGMLAATNAATAEFANARRKYLAVALMAGGYPLGATVGGTIASALLVDHSWHTVFLLGAGMSVTMLPVVWFTMPESVSFLTERRPPNALERTNRVLARLGHDVVDGLPPPRAATPALVRLFGEDLRRTTLLITAVFFTHMMTFYFILKWAPKIVADMGFAPSAAGGVLVWANVGGLAGSLVFSLLSQRFDVRPLAIVAALAGVVMVTVFGQSPAQLGSLSMLAAAAGFCTNGTIVCMYALMATRFPTDVRAAGTGFAIGIGRGGAALSPIIVGYMFQNGASLGVTAAAISLGSLVAVIALLALPKRPVAHSV